MLHKLVSWRIPLLFLFSHWFCYVALAGPAHLPPPPDSLRTALAAAPAGKAKAEVMLRVAKAYLVSFDTASVLYAREAEQVAIKLGDKFLQGRALNIQGSYYLDALEPAPAVPLLRKAEELLQEAPALIRAENYKLLGDVFANLDLTKKAIPLYHRAYLIYQHHHDTEGQGRLSNALGRMFSNQGQYDSAAHYLFKAARELEHSKDLAAQAEPLGNIAVLYFQQERYADALPYAFRALKLEQAKGDSLAMALSLENIGSMHFKLGKVPEALAYLRKAMSIYKHKNHEGYLVNAYNGLAMIHRMQNAVDSGAHYLKLSIALSNHKGPSWAGAMAMGNLAGLYQGAGRMKEAEEWATKAISKAEPGNDPPEAAIALQVLEQIAIAKGDFRKAHHFQRRTLLLNRKQFNKEQSQVTEELRASYEADQAEQQIVLLRQEQELNELKQQKQMAFTIAAAILAAALAAAFIWIYRKRQRMRELNIRSKLAADLHDDVGALLTQISLQGSLLEEDFYSDEERKKQLGQIGHASRRAVQQMSDVVWAVDSRNDGFGQLLDRMRDYAFELLTTADIEVDFDVPAELPLMRESFEYRQNLYFIFKEALHNIVKHTVATQVNVKLAVANKKLTLEIKDNGTDTGKNERLSGQGLRNMQMRAEAMEGHCTFLHDDGFCVQLTVPLTA